MLCKEIVNKYRINEFRHRTVGPRGLGRNGSALIDESIKQLHMRFRERADAQGGQVEQKI